MECLPFVEKCNGLVIWSAPPVKLPLNFQEIFLPNPLQGLLFKKDLSESETDQLAGILADEKHFTMVKEMIRATDPEFRETLPASLARQMVSDESKLLTESELPVAIFHGEHDSLINYDYYQNLAIPDLWNQKATLIRNASHSPHIEAPQEFNRLLVQFISDVNY
jgi:pimeloyl-ACP methyl ester carboxylesterase